MHWKEASVTAHQILSARVGPRRSPIQPHELDQIKTLCCQHDVTVRQFRISLEELPYSPPDLPAYTSR